MKDNSIAFVPLGGLCNRMRAMSSGVSIAKELGFPIRVYWDKRSDCYADFTELFQPVCLDGLTIHPLTSAQFYLIPNRKRNFNIPGLIRKVFFDHQILGSNECTDKSAVGPIQGRIYMSSCYSLAQHYPMNDLFVPAAEIMDAINRLRSLFSDHVIGIHIRRTDNIMSIKNNGIEDYFRFMDQSIETNPNIKFYLATDSMEVKLHMVRRYGVRILYHNATLDRKSVQGMKDAVVDLWCLSMTKEIIGSFYSSFSDIAAELGGINLRILG